MDSLQALRSVLESVPRALLASEAVRVLDGTLSSLDILARIATQRPLVVLVGPTGAGKSYIFNAIVGTDASPEGALRPTTSAVIIAGDPGVIAEMHVPDAEVVARPDMAITLVDMPERDGSVPDLAGFVGEPDLVVLVISPIRYADATVADLWTSLDASRATIVLNRVATAVGDLPNLVASVTDMFGTQPYVVLEDGDDAVSIADHIAGLIPGSRADTLASIMYRSAIAGSRFIVREITNAAIHIGEVANAIDGMPTCVVDVSTYDVQVSWDGTRKGIIERTAINARDRDGDVMRGSGTDLAERMLESIGPWEGDELSVALDLWHERCVESFLDASSIRWRRSSAEQLVRRFSWSTAINPGIVAPKRFSRIFGTRLDETSSQARADLERLICEALDARLSLWQAELNRLGDYQPGLLASAADDVESRRSACD
jgi:energy-coupling factor transporter ATP-binding protein EcfA2